MACSASDCVCAKKSTCSCGKQPALHCVCDKATTENVLPSASDACSCGKRLKSKCTCGVADSACEVREGEVDFTNMK